VNTSQLKLQRVRLGLTQADVAHFIGHSPFWVSMVERKKFRPTADDIFKLEKLLGIGLDDIEPGRGRFWSSGRTGMRP
jgi:transcriptional regulator with XRE-family HTH domain